MRWWPGHSGALAMACRTLSVSFRSSAAWSAGPSHRGDPPGRGTPRRECGALARSAAVIGGRSSEIASRAWSRVMVTSPATTRSQSATSGHSRPPWSSWVRVEGGTISPEVRLGKSVRQRKISLGGGREGLGDSRVGVVRAEVGHAESECHLPDLRVVGHVVPHRTGRRPPAPAWRTASTRQNAAATPAPDHVLRSGPRGRRPPRHPGARPARPAGCPPGGSWRGRSPTGARHGRPGGVARDCA